jgi:SAM-dependent methyltransferase
MNTASVPHQELSPSRWVQRFAHLVARQSRVLDVAAGRGRHARLFAGRGAHVTAVDRDADALSSLRKVPNVTVLAVDLEAEPWPFADTRFDAIVVVHYLHRALLPLLRRSLAPGGVLLYETFATGNAAFGRPRNPDFLLAPGELLHWAARAPALTVVAFEQGLVHDGEHASVVQRLAAVGDAQAWPPLLAESGFEPGDSAPIG